MIQKLTSFDPSVASNLPIINTLQGQQGFLLIWNDSMISITINYGTYSRLCPAGTFTVITLYDAVAQFTWTQEFIFPNVGQAPSSIVYIEGATVDESDYISHMTFPMPLPRLSNIGNQVSTTSANSVINDGQAVGTQVVEGTPVGAGSSQLLLKNDGTGKLGDGNLLINATQLTVQNGYTIDTTALAADALPSGVTLAASQVTTGALPSGVTLAASQVTAGALPSGVTLAASQVTAGALPSGVTSPNYVKHSGDTMTGTLTLSAAEGGGNAQLLTLSPSDAATVWQVQQETSTQILKIQDTTSGNYPIKFYTNGLVGLIAMGSNGLAGVTTFTGAAAGTYTHGLTEAPTTITALDNVTNSTNTLGCDTIGSTTVHMNVFNSPQAFVAAAIR
jgi:hypothetical protein